MKLTPKIFWTVVAALSAGVTAALTSGLIPAPYVPFAAGAATLLGSLLQKHTEAP